MSIKCDIDDCVEDAVVNCQVCKKNYCEVCNKKVHKTKITKDHQRNPIPPPTKPKCETVDDDDVGCDKDAVVYCKDCGENFCRQCDEDVHIASKTHQRNPIGNRPKSPKAKSPKAKTPSPKAQSPARLAQIDADRLEAARLAKQEADLLDAPKWIAVFTKKNQIVFAKVSDVKTDVAKFYRVIDKIKHKAKPQDLNAEAGGDRIPLYPLAVFLEEYSTEKAKELLDQIDIKFTDKTQNPNTSGVSMLKRYPLGVIMVGNKVLDLNEHKEYIQSTRESSDSSFEEFDDPLADEQKGEIDYIRDEAERYVKEILKVEMTKENLKKIKKDLEKKGVTVPKLEGKKEDITAALIEAVIKYIRAEYLMKLKDGVDCDLDKPCGKDQECDLKHKKCKPKSEFNYYEGMEHEKYDKNRFVGTHADMERLKAFKKAKKEAEKDAKKSEKDAEKDVEKSKKAGEKTKKEEREAEKEDELIEFSIGIEGDEKMEELQKQFLKCIGLIQ